MSAIREVYTPMTSGKAEYLTAEPDLETLCANCSQRYGEHRHSDDACPTERWFSETQKFQCIVQPVICSCGADLRAIPFVELQNHDGHEVAHA